MSLKSAIRSIAVALAFCAAAFLTTSLLLGGSAEQNEKYTLRDYGGRIAVFKYGEDKPDEVFDIFTSSLPESEVKRLQNGITVEGEKALQRLIEDYTG